MNDQFGRPDWHSWFMALAFVASQRSIDPSTKHGCVITTIDHNILSIGYNGPARGMYDSLVPLTRPEKYPFMAHAEANAIDNCTTNLKGAIVYVTGRPCSACLLRLLQRGVAKIYFGTTGSHCVNPDDTRISNNLLNCMKGDRRPEMIEYLSNDFMTVLTGTIDYVTKKNSEGSQRR